MYFGSPQPRSLIISGYTGTININGQTFSISGSTANTFASGTINDLPGTSVVSVNSTGNTTFSGTSFGASVNIVSGELHLNGSVFSNTAILEKKGATNDICTGGNTFNNTTTITNSGSGFLMLTNFNPDIFNGVLTLTNTGSNLLYAANNSPGIMFNNNIILNSTGTSLGIRFGQGIEGITLASGKILSIGGLGYTTGSLWFKNFVQSGTTAQTLTLTGNALLAMQSGTVFNGAINFTVPGFLLNGGTFNGTATFQKTGSSYDFSLGGTTFNNSLNIINNSTGTLDLANNFADAYNGDVTYQEIFW